MYNGNKSIWVFSGKVKDRVHILLLSFIAAAMKDYMSYTKEDNIYQKVPI